MNKKRITEFSNYLEAFTQRIVIRFPDAKDFINDEKTQMVDKFPELVPATVESRPSRPSQISLVKYALDSSVSEERRQNYFGVEDEIKTDTPEDCVGSINMLSSAIGSAHKDILFYSSLQGELLLRLKEFYGSAFATILRNNIDISRSHAFFLIKFHNLVLDYPRLLRCNLPLNYFKSNLSDIKKICSEDRIWVEV